MNRRRQGFRAGLASVAGLSALLASAAPPAFEEGVRLQAGGRDIEVDIGHLVPCVADWNGDGRKDLIAGQFLEGRIRLFLNTGTDAAPVVRDSVFLKAGGADIRLPCG